MLNGRLCVPPPAVRSMFYKSIVMLNICSNKNFECDWRSQNTHESNNFRFWLNSLVAYTIEMPQFIVMWNTESHSRQQEKKCAINCFHFEFRIRENSCVVIRFVGIPFTYKLLIFNRKCRTTSINYGPPSKWIISNINNVYEHTVSMKWRSRSSLLKSTRGEKRSNERRWRLIELNIICVYNVPNHLSISFLMVGYH